MVAACAQGQAQAQVQAQDGAESQIDAVMRDLKSEKIDYVIFAIPDGREYVQYFMNPHGVASQVPILFSKLRGVELPNNAYEDEACTLKYPEVDQSTYVVKINLPAESVHTLVSYLQSSGNKYEDTFCDAKDISGKYVGYTRSLFIQATPENGRWEPAVRGQFRSTFGFEPQDFIVKTGKFDPPADSSSPDRLSAVAKL